MRVHRSRTAPTVIRNAPPHRARRLLPIVGVPTDDKLVHRVVMGVWSAGCRDGAVRRVEKQPRPRSYQFLSVIGSPGIRVTWAAPRRPRRGPLHHHCHEQGQPRTGSGAGVGGFVRLACALPGGEATDESGRRSLVDVAVEACSALIRHRRDPGSVWLSVLAHGHIRHRLHWTHALAQAPPKEPALPGW